MQLVKLSRGKSSGSVAARGQLSQRTNALWMGTMWWAAAHSTGRAHWQRNRVWQVSDRLKLRPLETEFERGIRQFGYFLMEVTLVACGCHFCHQRLSGASGTGFIFILFSACCWTNPQLLPAIISINLSHGAKRMAKNKVIVKRLASIENFGSMNVICSDKTGTLTEGTVKLHPPWMWMALPAIKSFFNLILMLLRNRFYQSYRWSYPQLS